MRTKAPSDMTSEENGSFISDSGSLSSASSSSNEGGAHAHSTGGGVPNPNEPVSEIRKEVNKPKRRITIADDTAQHNSERVSSHKAVSEKAHHEVYSELELGDSSEDVAPKSKATKKLGIIIGGAVLAVGVLVGAMVVGGSSKEPESYSYVYEKTGMYVLDTYLNSIINFDAESIGAIVDNSYIAKEMKYANNNTLREEFVRKVCSLVSFDYGMQDFATTGVLPEASNGRGVQVTAIDYDMLCATMVEESEAIKRLYTEAGYAESDFTFHDEMVDLMVSYLLGKSELPTKTFTLDFNISTRTSASEIDGTQVTDTQYYLVDDIALDKLLFSSDEFHAMCDTFTKVATDWTGMKFEEYTVSELVENPKYTEWKKLLDKYMAEDDGVFNRKTSKWEPWFLRDENNNYILDDTGEKIVEYYTIKDADGYDIMQPDEKVHASVTKTREVEDVFVNESGVHYTWLGAYYCENEYTGSSISNMQVGDGSFDYPAGVGTSVVTKVLDTSGVYRNVRITLMGYWTGDDAVSYALSFSEKNRGFDSSSIVKLICYEVKVENLDSVNIEVESEMFLSDARSNQSARTGTVYGFTSSAVIPVGGSVVINDWATSTELPQKYVCWGKNFGREFNVVWFRVLAGGSGEVESFDANASTINKSN